MNVITPTKQELPKGTFRMTYEEQLAAVPKVLRSYWKKLAEKNSYYNHVFILNWADGLENELVLDAGCGQSSSIGRRQHPLHYIVGIDPLRDDMQINASLRHKSQGVLEQLPFADAAFAAVHCDSVFEHISDPARVVSEFYRVLKPGGRVLVNTNSVFNPFMFPNKFLSVRQREWLKTKMRINSEGTYPAPYRINTRRRLIRYLQQAGFADIQIYRWGLPNLYHPRWFLTLQLVMELAAKTPLFCGLKHRLMATCRKPPLAQ